MLSNFGDIIAKAFGYSFDTNSWDPDLFYLDDVYFVSTLIDVISFSLVCFAVYLVLRCLKCVFGFFGGDN